MLSGKRHQNKPLISVTDGKKLGEVKDLYLDGEMKKVVAVFLGTEGLIKRKARVIERAAVQVLGEDAWLITDSDRVIKLSDLPGADTFAAIGELRGREIETEGGTKIGTIEDVLLDENANVLGFSLSKVYVQGPLSERKTITRAAITTLGSKDTPMTTVLARAEESLVPEARPDLQNKPAAEQPPG